MNRRTFLQAAFGAAAYQAVPRVVSALPVASPATPRQIQEMAKRLKPYYDGHPKTVTADKDWLPLLEATHHNLTEALNKGRPESEYVKIPMPQIFVFDCMQATIEADQTDDKDNPIHFVARTRNLDNLLDDNRKKLVLGHELTHLALGADPTKRTANTLGSLISDEQYFAIKQLIETGEKQNIRDAGGWLREMLSDQGARIATCADMIDSAVDIIDTYNVQQRKQVLGDLYPVYEKLSDAEHDKIANISQGLNENDDSELPGAHPPNLLRGMGRPLQSRGFCLNR